MRIISDSIKSSSKLAKRNVRSKVQDDRLKEMVDDGMCLTMHQPWAGLLIKGRNDTCLSLKNSLVTLVFINLIVLFSSPKG